MPIENHVSLDIFSQFGYTTFAEKYVEQRTVCTHNVDDTIYHYHRIVKRSRTREGFTVERIAASPVSSYTRMKMLCSFCVAAFVSTFIRNALVPLLADPPLNSKF